MYVYLPYVQRVVPPSTETKFANRVATPLPARTPDKVYHTHERFCAIGLFHCLPGEMRVC